MEDLSVYDSQNPKSKAWGLEDAFNLGLALKYLEQAAENPANHEIGKREGDKILGTALRIGNALNEHDIESPVLSQIHGFSEKIEDNYEPSEVLDADDSEELQKMTAAWKNLIDQDLSKIQIISAANTGLLDPEKLVNSPSEVMQPSVWSWLGDQQKSDLREAAKSIAVGSPTASVMLSLRTVERALRDWYEMEEGEVSEDSWGGFLDELMNTYGDEKHENDTVLTQLSTLPPVLSNLNYLREKRNEVSHPEKSPSPEEARRTLMIVAGTISDIYSEVNQRRFEDTEHIDIQIEDSDEPNDVIYKLIRELSEEGKDGVKLSKIYEQGKKLSMTENEISDAIERILLAGRAFESGSDKIKPI